MTFRSLLVCLLTLVAPCAPAALATQNAEPDLEAEFRANLERRMDRHPYFKRIALEWFWDYEDYVVVVQSPQKPEAGYAEKAAKLEIGDSLVLNQAFRDGLAKTLGVQLRATSPRMVIVVLATRGDFKNYCQLIHKYDPGGWKFAYDPGARLFVTCRTPFSTPTMVTASARMVEFYERGRQLVHAYSARSEALPDPHWLACALAAEIAGWNDLEATKKRGGSATQWTYHKLCTALVEPERRRATLLPLQTLMQPRDRAGVLQALRSQAAAAEVKPVSGFEAWDMYTAQVGAFLHWATTEAERDLRDRMLRFTGAAMKQQLQMFPFEKVFDGVNWAQVESDFWWHVWRRHERLSPKEELDVEALQAFLVERSQSAPEGVAAAAASPVDARPLLEHFASPDERLALALALVQSGDAAGALTALEAALEAAPDTERLRREQARIEAWMAERARYLEFLAAEAKKLVIEHNGKRLVAEVARVEDGRVVFASSNQGLDSLDVEELDAVALAERMLERKSGFDASWAAAYPLVLAPGVSASRHLKGAEPERFALAADAEEDYPGRAALVDALDCAARIAAVLEAERPEDAPLPLDEVAPLLEALADLWATREELPVVQQLKPRLVAAGELALASEFAELGLSDLLAGHVEERRDGSIFLRYDFSDPVQLADWPLDNPYQQFHDQSQQRSGAFPMLEIEGMELVGYGEVSRTHVLGFKGKQRMSWKENVSSGGTVTSDKILSYRFGLCTVPGKRSFLATYNSLDLCLRDVDAQEYIFDSPAVNDTRFDTDYTNTLEFDGESTLTLLRDGMQVHSIASGSRKDGHPQLWIHSDYKIRIASLELSGTVTRASLDGLRLSWTAARLAELGL